MATPIDQKFHNEQTCIKSTADTTCCNNLNLSLRLPCMHPPLLHDLNTRLPSSSFIRILGQRVVEHVMRRDSSASQYVCCGKYKTSCTHALEEPASGLLARRKLRELLDQLLDLRAALTG
ncbi:unnamed protein product [Periconia digitata]|uniref:Uncharacterized protein n=1 Tax=Periconia digitata TaxID=1303443 RepID=A0A9W4U699_9PLEO|nr:unnamed protein product [Periconia digitata]